MFQTFLIGLREGLEAALIVAISACGKDEAAAPADAAAGGSPATAAAATEAAAEQAAAQADALAALSADELRERGRTAYAESRLYAPAGDNALEYYLALRQKSPGDAAVAKDRGRFSHAPLVVAVVARLDPADTAIPVQERLLTAGCACFALLQAAQGLGFGASWLTGWPAYDPEVMALLGLGGDERIAGFIHVGTPKLDPPERDRPDPSALLQAWTPPA